MQLTVNINAAYTLWTVLIKPALSRLRFLVASYGYRELYAAVRSTPLLDYDVRATSTSSFVRL